MAINIYHKLVVAAAGAFLTFAALEAPPAEAASFTFTNIADTNGLFGGFALGYGPAISDNGTVAFFGGLETGGSGLFTGNGSAITPIVLENNADSTSPFTSVLGDFSINNNGTLAFNGQLTTGGSGLFTSNGSSITQIAIGGSPSINNIGTVAFYANNLPGVGEGIFTSNGGFITTIADTSGPFSTFGGDVAINDNGTVVFDALLKAGGEGIFTGNGGSVTTIADTSGSFSSFGFDPDINDSGTVIFTAALNTGGFGIFTGNGGSITTIADTSGSFERFNNTSINNSGTVAFSALLKEGGQGIFTGPDPVADKVIAFGDSVFSSTLTYAEFPRQGLNNSGQLTFYGFFENQYSAIVRADPISNSPTSIPEPSSLLGLLSMGVLGTSFRHKRK
jgi:hypothetical protein